MCAGDSHARNNTQPRRHLSKHVYQEVPRSSPLSRKAVFHQLAVKAGLVQGPDRVSTGLVRTSAVSLGASERGTETPLVLESASTFDGNHL